MRKILLALMTVLYPLVVYFGLGHFEPRWLALLLLGLALLRLVASPQRFGWLAAGSAGLLATITLVANVALPLKLYPVIVSSLMLALFATSLAHPPTAIERLARLSTPDLPPEAVAYTRKVTWVWCAFFVLNGTLAAVTALWCSDDWWALYNGLIAYGLMGMLFCGEWLVRRWVMPGGARV